MFSYLLEILIDLLILFSISIFISGIIYEIKTFVSLSKHACVRFTNGCTVIYFTFLILVKLCPQIGHVENGRALNYTNMVGTKVEIVCNEGFSRRGNGFLECRQNGTWSSNPPSCTGMTRTVT